MEELLTVKTKFESNRTYIAGCEEIHIYPKDTILCTDPEVLASCRKAGKSCNVAFLLRDIENTVLDFHGAKLVFHGRIVPFVLLNCKNVTVKNLKIDYDRPFFTQADVLEVKPDELRIRICDGFDYEIRDGYLYAKSETWEKNLNANDCLLWMYDKTEVKNYEIMLALFGKEIFPNENPPMPIRQLQIIEQGGEQIIRGEFPQDWDYNSGNNALLITHEVRNKNTFNILGCEDISILDCTLIHGASLGIVGKHTHNLTVDHFDMYRDYAGNGRLVTNNADAIHLYNCSGKVTVTNCFMEGLLDDTVNIHNNYLSVKDVCGNRLVMYSRAAGLSVNLKLFNVGDSVAVYRGRTQEKVTELVITEMEIDEQEQVYRMTVEGDAAGILADDTVENLSAQPEILISGCTFGSFRGTMRLQSRGRTVVRDC